MPPQSVRDAMADAETLPVWATGDDHGISTYPEPLCGDGYKSLHIYHRDERTEGPLCGVSTKQWGLVEYLGSRRVRVCSKCRTARRAVPALRGRE